MRRAVVPVRVRGSVVQVGSKDASRDAVVHVATAQERTDARGEEKPRPFRLTSPDNLLSLYEILS